MPPPHRPRAAQRHGVERAWRMLMSGSPRWMRARWSRRRARAIGPRSHRPAARRPVTAPLRCRAASRSCRTAASRGIEAEQHLELPAALVGIQLVSCPRGGFGANQTATEPSRFFCRPGDCEDRLATAGRGRVHGSRGRRRWPTSMACRRMRRHDEPVGAGAVEGAARPVLDRHEVVAAGARMLGAEERHRVGDRACVVG
jgi:hypothetical protein